MRYQSNFYRISILLFVVFYFSSLAGNISAQDTRRERDWNKIVTLQDQANKEGELDKKLELFRQAANLLEQYISKYQNSNTIINLKLRYRLGTYRENANQQGAAKNEYTICKNHPLINDPQAQIDGQSISSLVNERLNQLDAISRPPAPAVPAISGSSHTAVQP